MAKSPRREKPAREGTVRHSHATVGASVQLLAACGIETDKADTGLPLATAEATDAADAFVAALAQHRHVVRETDPPRV